MSEAPALSEQRSLPKSVQPGFPRLGITPDGWVTRSIGEVLQPVERRVALRDDERYQLVTAKRNRGGIVPRDRLLGRDILTKTQFEVLSGDFLISRRQIAHGACGIVPIELNGAVVSNEYAALLPGGDLDPGFLRHLPHSIYFQQTCFHSSIGVHVEKLVFNMEAWLKWPFPFPPTPEQRRIAEVLDAWDDAIATTKRVIAAKRASSRGLMQRLVDGSEAPRRELDMFAKLVSDKVDPANFGGVSVELDNIESSTGRLLGTTTLKPGGGVRHQFTRGDVLFGKLRPYLAKYVLADGEGLTSTEVWVLRADRKMCVPGYLYYLVQSQAFAAAANKPTGSRMPRAEWEIVRETPLPLPSLAAQERVVGMLACAEAAATAAEEVLDRLRLQKRGLMRKLLTGEWRVGVGINELVPAEAPTVEAAE